MLIAGQVSKLTNHIDYSPSVPKLARPIKTEMDSAPSVSETPVTNTPKAEKLAHYRRVCSRNDSKLEILKNASDIAQDFSDIVNLSDINVLESKFNILDSQSDFGTYHSRLMRKVNLHRYCELLDKIDRLRNERDEGKTTKCFSWITYDS